MTRRTVDDDLWPLVSVRGFVIAVLAALGIVVGAWVYVWAFVIVATAAQS